jgi:hypothetical protein
MGAYSSHLYINLTDASRLCVFYVDREPIRNTPVSATDASSSPLCVRSAGKWSDVTQKRKRNQCI